MAVVFATTLFTPRRCSAEFLYFARGGRVQAAATVMGDCVRIDTPAGSETFLLTDFVKIAPGGCPEQDWDGRRAAARQGDASAQFAAGWWALENGLVPEAADMFREASALDSEHPALARCQAALDRLDRPVNDADSALLRRALGVPLQELRGPHVLLLHQHDEDDARARLDLLERVVVTYYLLAAGQGIDVAVPNHRLVSVYLKSHEDYLAFLKSQHAEAFRTTLGYFHPNFLAVVAYDARLNRRSQTNPRNALTAESDPARRDQARRRLLSALDALSRDHGTAAHEMIHLLVAESRLEPWPGAFPHWLHEGFAAQFEVVRGGRWAGVGRAHDLRLADFRSLNVSPALSPIIRDAGFGQGYRRDLYARSWALVYFLRKARPVDFQAFLDLLRVPQPNAPSNDGERYSAAFTASFGTNLDGLEAEWKAFMIRVQTPLDENDSGAAPTPRVSGGITIDRIGAIAKMLKSVADGA